MELQYRGSGKVYYAEKEYQSDLYYNEKEGSILLKIIVKNENKLGGFWEVPFDIPFLCGQLESGFKFTLLHLVRNGMKDLISYGITEYNFYVDYILCGIGSTTSHEQTFRKVSYTLSNIVEWGEESIYAIGEKHELFSKNEEIKKTIFKGSDYSISYSVFGSILPVVEYDLLKEHIDIEQHGIIEIEFQNEEPFFKFCEIFDKLKRLFEIAVLRRINVEKVTAYSSEIVYLLGDTTIEQPIDVYGQNITEETIKEIPNNYRWKWISLSELIKNNSFEHYFGKHEKLAPIVELFLEPLYVKINSNTRIFLNIVQALETYHSRFVTNSIDEYRVKVDHLSKARPIENAEELKKFLLANSNKFITLKSRLADLLFADGNIFFDTGKIKRNDFPSVIAHSRNYYIHYDESIKEKYRVLSEEELQIYNRALLQILEYYILLEFGFSVDTVELKNKLIERWGNISQDLDILDISKKRHNS